MSLRGKGYTGGGGGGKKRERTKPQPGALCSGNLKRLRGSCDFCCGLCGCCDGGEAVSECQVDVCQKCWKRYTSAFTTYGDICVVIEGVQDEGSTIQK
eukprot:4206958-Pyramimonas_sp.AAC.1